MGTAIGMGLLACPVVVTELKQSSELVGGGGAYPGFGFGVGECPEVTIGPIHIIEKSAFLTIIIEIRNYSILFYTTHLPT